MAEVLLKRINFLTNDNSPYVAGDILEVYADTDLITESSTYISTGIVAYLNGVLSSSGPYNPIGGAFDSNFNFVTYFVVESFNTNICITTSLFQWSDRYAFPYVHYVTFANHPSCVIGELCDLIIIGTPTVIGTSAPENTDGSIEINATSSNVIQYKIGSDFVYDDGTAQTSNIFSGLITGIYRIYLRDSVNCGANILVSVPVSYDYGEVFRMEYDDLNGNTTRISITKRSYLGSYTEVCGSGEPFILSLRGEGSTDKFDPILSAQGVVNLKSESNQFLELYTNDPNLYRIEFYKDFGSGFSRYWLGKVLPQQYQESYKAPPYYVTCVSTDSLAELKDYFLLQRDTQPYYGTVKVIKLIAECLKYIGFNLNIRVGVNLYATTMDQTSADDPLDQAYVDYEAFYLSGRDPNLFNVLESILSPFCARIVLWDNKWNIIRVEETIDSFDYREFDSDGEYISNGTYDPVVDINYPTVNDGVHFTNLNQNLEIRPGAGNIKCVYKLGLKPNILKNGDFRLRTRFIPSENKYVIDGINLDDWTIVNGGYALLQSYRVISENNVGLLISAGQDVSDAITVSDLAYVQSNNYNIKMGTNNSLKFLIVFQVPISSTQIFGTVFKHQVPYYKLRVIVQYGSLYLLSDGSWSSDENILTFFITEFDKFNEVEFIAKQPTSGTPVTGMDLQIKIYHSYIFYRDFETLSDLKALVTYTGGNMVIPTGYRTELFATTQLRYYVLEENTSSDNDDYIVRPDDYHAVNNPRQWVKKGIADLSGVVGQYVFTMIIDKVQLSFLTDSKDPYDSIIRTVKGEKSNAELIEKELILGSSMSLITTESYLNLSPVLTTALFQGAFDTSPNLTLITTNALSYELIYTGYFRSSLGVGYESWARDGVSEADKLHGIFLRQYAAQYKRSWRLLRGSFRNTENVFFGLISTAREVNDSNRIYLPIALTLNDLRQEYDFELLELNNSVIPGGSDGSGESPYSSGFTNGFGASSFN